MELIILVAQLLALKAFEAAESPLWKVFHMTTALSAFALLLISAMVRVV